MPSISFFRLNQIWTRVKEIQKEFVLNEERLKVIQEHRAKLLIQSLKEIPYYSKYLKTTDSTDLEINPLKVIKSLPILTRVILQSKFPNALVNSKLKSRLSVDSTSGSTSQPLVFGKDKAVEDYKIATQVVFNQMTGWRMGEPQISFWGYHPTNYKGKIWNQLIYRNTIFPPYNKNLANLKLVLNNIKKKKPTLITGYSSALYFLSQEFSEHSLSLGYTPKALIASAESLLPKQREEIEKQFNAPVFMRYGTREVDNIAIECAEHDGYHVLESRYLIEIIGPDDQTLEQGKEGRIVVTDLMNHVSPFVRYDLGDIGALEYSDCLCGRCGLKLSHIKGRATDFLHLKDGTLFPSLVFNIVLEQMGEYIKMVQIEIVNSMEWTLRVIPKQFINNEIEQTIINEFRKYTGKSVNFTFDYVDKLKQTSSGKTPFIIFNK